jgi:hypothetical protein
MYKIYVYILLASIVSCVNSAGEKKPIAKVHENYLYKEDIKNILPPEYSKEDSMVIVNSYINKWAIKQLLLEKAKINLAENQQDIEHLVIQYRQDLLIDKYKEAIVNQDLDTVVTDDDIKSFYDENKEIFKLNEELLKFRYIFFGNDILNPKDFIKLFKTNNFESDKKIIEQELQLKSYFLNDSVWVSYDQVINKKPFLRMINKNKFLRKNKFFQKEDSLGTYLVEVKDVLLRNDNAPMSYVLSTIKQMIFHKRKLELFKKIEKTLTEDAIKNKEFQIY